MTDAPPLPAAFGSLIAAVPTGVTVVATDGEAGRAGQTVSAMSCASYEPPMLLICVHRRSPLNDLIAANETFAVSVLATSHDHVADTFAGRPWPGKQRWDFTCGRWVGSGNGSPVLADAVAAFDCTLAHRMQAGSHVVHIGSVTDARAGDGVPLVYADRRYGRHQQIEPSTFADFPDARPQSRTRRTS